MHMAWSGLSDREKEPRPPRSWGYSGHGVQGLGGHRHPPHHKDKNHKHTKSKDHKDQENVAKYGNDLSPTHAQSGGRHDLSPTTRHGKAEGSGGLSPLFGRSPKHSPRNSPKSPKSPKSPVRSWSPDMLCWVSYVKVTQVMFC